LPIHSAGSHDPSLDPGPPSAELTTRAIEACFVRTGPAGLGISPAIAAKLAATVPGSWVLQSTPQWALGSHLEADKAEISRLNARRLQARSCGRRCHSPVDMSKPLAWYDPARKQPANGARWQASNPEKGLYVMSVTGALSDVLKIAWLERLQAAAHLMTKRMKSDQPEKISCSLENGPPCTQSDSTLSLIRKVRR